MAHPNRDRGRGPSHPDMRTKKQVTVRMTEQFAKDLNLIMACSRTTNASGAVQDAVHRLAEYYRHQMAASWAALQEGEE